MIGPVAAVHPPRIRHLALASVLVWSVPLLAPATAISQEANGVVLLDADGTRLIALTSTG